MSRIPLAILALAALSSGCLDGASSPAPSADGDQGLAQPGLLHHASTFNLTAGWDLPPQATGVVYGNAFQKDNCGTFGVHERYGGLHVVSGNATLAWDNPDVKASLRLGAEGGAVNQETPRGPSPIVVSFEDLDVTYTYRLVFVAKIDSGPSLMQDVRLDVQFDYTGDEAWPLALSCWR